MADMFTLRCHVPGVTPPKHRITLRTSTDWDRNRTMRWTRKAWTVRLDERDFTDDLEFKFVRDGEWMEDVPDGPNLRLTPTAGKTYSYGPEVVRFPMPSSRRRSRTAVSSVSPESRPAESPPATLGAAAQLALAEHLEYGYPSRDAALAAAADHVRQIVAARSDEVCEPGEGDSWTAIVLDQDLPRVVSVFKRFEVGVPAWGWLVSGTVPARCACLPRPPITPVAVVSGIPRLRI